MKISELLERLGELQGEHGDIDVKVYVPFKRKAAVADAENVDLLYADEARTEVHCAVIAP